MSQSNSKRPSRTLADMVKEQQQVQQLAQPSVILTYEPKVQEVQPQVQESLASPLEPQSSSSNSGADNDLNDINDGSSGSASNNNQNYDKILDFGEQESAKSQQNDLAQDDQARQYSKDKLNLLEQDQQSESVDNDSQYQDRNNNDILGPGPPESDTMSIQNPPASSQICSIKEELEKLHSKLLQDFALPKEYVKMELGKGLCNVYNGQSGTDHDAGVDGVDSPMKKIMSESNQEQEEDNTNYNSNNFNNTAYGNPLTNPLHPLNFPNGVVNLNQMTYEQAKSVSDQNLMRPRTFIDDGPGPMSLIKTPLAPPYPIVRKSDFAEVGTYVNDSDIRAGIKLLLRMG